MLTTGNIVYLVAAEWFLVWVRYIQIYNFNEVEFINKDKKDEGHKYNEDSITQQINLHWITRPSKINNLPLLGEYEEDLK